MNDFAPTTAPLLDVTTSAATTLDVDALVVGVRATPQGPRVEADLPDGASDRLAALAVGLGVHGAVDEVHRLPSPDGVTAPVLVLVGLGPEPSPGAPAAAVAESLRRAAGAATRTLAGVGSVALALPATEPAHVAAALEGAALGAYAFRRYATGPDRRPAVERVVAVAPTGAGVPSAATVERARVLADGVHLVRDLVNTAPNDLYPEVFAALAREAAKSAGLKVTVLDDKALAAGGYGGLVAVGQGSVRGPRLVKVSWTPPRSRRHQHVALVGKGITFDSGGLSIKPAGGMETMKSDMAGAATVLAVVVAAARLRLPVAVTGWLCLAENMPSGTAQRPGDVITMRGGTTVEVLNTDAEGRLVLGDGLVAATEEGPDVVLDVATLTGAQVVALGHRVSAVMGTDDARAEVQVAADAAGEQFWPMPLPADLRDGLRSKVADIANIGDRAGGMLTAGLFLKEFVGTTPWAHLDVAGPAFNEKEAYGYTPVGGTGVAVRTLLELVEARARR